VADVGCGAGLALIEIAKAYPLCELHGYEISAHALRRAEANKRMAGLHHVHFHDMRAEPLPQDASFDLVCTFDCLHDMTDPLGVLRAIRRALRPEGILLVAEIKARPTYEENVERNPMAAMMYARSVMSCMSSALSEPGGAGLGTLGLHKDLLRQMTLEAGFGGFEQRDFGHPVNTYYDIRI
jgi:ubiquinone/menaquinone biosynthesis C-methylase UbiE